MEKPTELSPFEFKDELIRMASSQADRTMHNAGRGNPNFLATAPRHAFLRLGDFALKESERSYSFLDGHFGGAPEKEGIVERFDNYAQLHEDKEGNNGRHGQVADSWKPHQNQIIELLKRKPTAASFTIFDFLNLWEDNIPKGGTNE